MVEEYVIEEPATDPPSSIRATLKRIVLTVLTIGVVGATLVALVSAWVMFRIQYPRVTTAERADAIVVFAGDEGRLERGLALLDDGLADHLLINRGINDEAGVPHPAPAACDDPRYDGRVECLVVTEDSTRGEARAYARIAEENGWENLIVVSADYHLSRATLLIDRCFDGRIQPVASPYDADRYDIEDEFFKLGHATTVARSC